MTITNHRSTARHFPFFRRWNFVCGMQWTTPLTSSAIIPLVKLKSWMALFTISPNIANGAITSHTSLVHDHLPVLTRSARIFLALPGLGCTPGGRTWARPTDPSLLAGNRSVLHQIKLQLNPGGTQKIIFLLGYHENPEDAKFDPPGIPKSSTKRLSSRSSNAFYNKKPSTRLFRI